MVLIDILIFILRFILVWQFYDCAKTAEQEQMISDAIERDAALMETVKLDKEHVKIMAKIAYKRNVEKGRFFLHWGFPFTFSL